MERDPDVSLVNHGRFGTIAGEIIPRLFVLRVDLENRALNRGRIEWSRDRHVRVVADRALGDAAHAANLDPLEERPLNDVECEERALRRIRFAIEVTRQGNRFEVAGIIEIAKSALQDPVVELGPWNERACGEDGANVSSTIASHRYGVGRSAPTGRGEILGREDARDCCEQQETEGFAKHGA